MKSLELQVLWGSPSEGCFYFIFSFPCCKQQRGSEKEGFRGLRLQRSYNTLCFLQHDTAWQNKVFILCTCQLRSASSKMMKYYRICCCLFPLGTCADLFKVSSAPSKCFIYYSWHLKNIWGKYIRASHVYCFPDLLLFTYVLTQMQSPNDLLCFLRVHLCVCVPFELLWWGFWRRAPVLWQKCVLTPDGVSLTLNYRGESLMSSRLRNFVQPLLKLFPLLVLMLKRK